jgi:DNA-binding transcriptional regulator YiaG
MNVGKTQAKKKQNPAMKTINGRKYEQGGHLKRTEDMITRDESNETIVLDALRRFMINSDLSDQRISRLMGAEIETLRTWIAGTANPRKHSLNKIRSFLKWHGENT